MTTERQSAANRANARKSTGPRTSAGRKRSAGNAHRHGLTGVLPAEQVLGWYRLVLDDDTAEPDPFEHDPERRAAYALAEAEANLARVRTAEARQYEGVLAALANQRQDQAMLVDMLRDLADHGVPARDTGRLAQGIGWLFRTAYAQNEVLWRALARYRAECEARRHKALRAYSRALKAKSRNEANLAYR